LLSNNDQEQQPLDTYTNLCMNIIDGRTFINYTTDSQLQKQQFENSATNFYGSLSLLEISTALHSSNIISSYLLRRHSCKVHTNLLTYVFVRFCHGLTPNVIVKIKSRNNIRCPFGISYRRPNRERINTSLNAYGSHGH
jgi:hypothetical protein